MGRQGCSFKWSGQKRPREQVAWRQHPRGSANALGEPAQWLVGKAGLVWLEQVTQRALQGHITREAVGGGLVQAHMGRVIAPGFFSDSDGRHWGILS